MGLGSAAAAAKFKNQKWYWINFSPPSLMATAVASASDPDVFEKCLSEQTCAGPWPKSACHGFELSPFTETLAADVTEKNARPLILPLRDQSL